MSELAEKLASEFQDKEYAHEYMAEFQNLFIAAQIKALRDQRAWSQEELAQAAEMKQERISALESVDYDSWTVKTLRKLAKAFDVNLNVSFQSFGDGILDVVNMKKGSLAVESREEALQKFDDCILRYSAQREWFFVNTPKVHMPHVQTAAGPLSARAASSEWQTLSSTK